MTDNVRTLRPLPAWVSCSVLYITRDAWQLSLQVTGEETGKEFLLMAGTTPAPCDAEAVGALITGDTLAVAGAAVRSLGMYTSSRDAKSEAERFAAQWLAGKVSL